MSWHVDLDPDARALVNELALLATSDGVDLSRYLDPETLELAEHIYLRRLYRLKDVKGVMRRIAASELAGMEKTVYEMFCKRRVVFDSYLARLSFERRFGRFRRFFVGGSGAEYRMQVLVHRFHYLKEDVVDDVRREIGGVPGDRVWAYVGSFGSACGREAILEAMGRVRCGMKAFVGSFLGAEDYYDEMCKVVLGSSSDTRQEIISSMGTIDKDQFYRSLLGVWGASEASGGLDGVIEIMKLVRVGRAVKMEILRGCLNGLVYWRRLGEFTRLFKQMERIGDGGDEWEVFGKLYKAICNYKRTGTLDLKEFLKECSRERERGRFSVYRWRDIFGVYKG